MKSREWKQIVRGVLPSDTKWAFRQNLCYSIPVNHVLFGVEMATSRSVEYIFINRIALPLFVPTSLVYGGERVRGARSQMISVENEDIGAIATKVFSAGYNENYELKKMVLAGQDTRNTLQTEIAGYAKFLLGDDRAALKILLWGLALHRDSSEDLRPFVIATRQRMESVCEMLRADDLEAVRAQLKRWTDFSASNLGLVRTA